MGTKDKSNWKSNLLLATRVLVETACNTPTRDRAKTFNIMILVCGSFTAIIVILRLGYKQFFSPKRRLDMHDWPILLAVAFGVASMGLTVGGLVPHGLGKDVWGVSSSDMRYFGILFYTIQIIYVTLICLIKLSLCLFYINIFRGTTSQRILWVTAAMHFATMLAFVITIIFECLPISSQWSRYDYSELNGGGDDFRCVDINAIGWSNAGLNVASDFWLLIIPMWHIPRLDLHWKKKVGVALMFGAGAWYVRLFFILSLCYNVDVMSSVTVISFLRLQALSEFNRTTNPTWDQWGLVWWSAIEILVALICTSLPTMRLILVHVAPSIFGSSTPICDSGHMLPSFDRFDSIPNCGRASDANNDSHLIVDEERGEIRTRPLCASPGFKKIPRVQVKTKRVVKLYESG